MSAAPSKNYFARYHIAMREMERQLLTFYLEQANYNIGDAAILADVDGQYLGRRLRALGMKVRRKDRRIETAPDNIVRRASRTAASELTDEHEHDG